MKPVIFAMVFAGAVWAADEAADRTAIENTVRFACASPTRPGLFTSDFDDAELVRFKKVCTPESGAIPITVDGKPGTLVISKEPMGEATWFPATANGSVGVKKIRFVTPDVAIVDVAAKSPVFMVLRRVGTDWKIASIRMLAPC
jgi:hypothetical protein